jgi:peptide/nickel transport system permease protein
MWLYALRRVAFAIPSMIVAVVLVAFVSLQIPANPADSAREGAGPGRSEANGEAFSTWFSGLLSGDLGLSLLSNQPVSEIIAKRYPITLELLLLSLFVAYAIALPASLLLSRKQISLDSSIARMVGFFGLALPAVCVAVALLVWSLTQTAWPIGFIELRQDLFGNLRSLLLPVLALALPFAAIQIPSIHAIRMGEMHALARLPMGAYADQAQYASSRRGMPYAFLPVLSNLGLQIGMFLSASLVIEAIFNIPGIGFALMQSGLSRDLPLVLGIVTVFIGLCVLFTAGIYLFYGLIDLMSARSRATIALRPAPMAALFAKLHRFWLAVLLVASLSILVLVFVASSGQDSIGLSIQNRLQPPSAEHWLGTDELGRDRFGQLLSGARISFAVSLQGTLLALFVGGLLGLVAGALGGMPNRLLIGLSEVFLAVPAVMLGLVLLVNNPGSRALLALTIALATTPLFARTVSAAMAQLKAEWAEQSARRGRTIVRRLLVPILAQACFGFVIALSIETTLSFLGLGAQPPELSLGALLNNGLRFARDTPSALFAPTFSIVLVSFLFMLLSDALNRLAAQPIASEELPAVQSQAVVDNSL